jgi:hypothetical protein
MLTHEQWRNATNKIKDTDNRFGMLPSPPDPRDFQYKAFAGTQPLPSAFSRKDEMPPVRNQGKLGTCVSFATWAMKEWQENQQKDTPNGGLSPRFIYQIAKQLDGQPTTAGTHPRVALQVLQKYGDAPESLFPYSGLISDVNLPMPPQNVIDSATPYKINTFVQLNGLEEVKRAIVEQSPVELGIMVTESFVESKNYVSEISGNMLGGHAIIACAYDDNIKLGNYTGGILLMNSWGTSWAQNGFVWLPYDAWNWMLDKDLGIPFIMEAWASVDMPYAINSAKEIVLKVNSNQAYVDGTDITLDVSPQLTNNRALIPIRFVAENMGYIVNYEEDTQVIEIRKP